MIISIALSLMIGIVFGSIPFGVLLAKLHGLPDPRSIGSGNIGATNMLRSGRKGVAATTLLLDGLKAAIAVLVVDMLIAPHHGSVAILGAIIGHVYSPWLGFKGGKGVACAIGGLLAFAPLTGLITCSIWLTIFFSTRISSLSAMVALLLAPFILWWNIGPYSAIIFMLAVAIIVYRHKENIERLMRAEEPRFAFSRKEDDEAEANDA